MEAGQIPICIQTIQDEEYQIKASTKQIKNERGKNVTSLNMFPKNTKSKK
jgi:hypothetical protein